MRSKPPSKLLRNGFSISKPSHPHMECCNNCGGWEEEYSKSGENMIVNDLKNIKMHSFVFCLCKSCRKILKNLLEEN